MAKSSANSIIVIPSTLPNSEVNSLITKLKKKGEVLFPCGHPLFKLIFFPFYYIFIEAVDRIHFEIKNSRG